MTILSHLDYSFEERVRAAVLAENDVGELIDELLEERHGQLKDAVKESLQKRPRT